MSAAINKKADGLSEKSRIALEDLSALYREIYNRKIDPRGDDGRKVDYSNLAKRRNKAEANIKKTMRTEGVKRKVSTPHEIGLGRARKRVKNVKPPPLPVPQLQRGQSVPNVKSSVGQTSQQTQLEPGRVYAPAPRSSTRTSSRSTSSGVPPLPDAGFSPVRRSKSARSVHSRTASRGSRSRSRKEE